MDNQKYVRSLGIDEKAQRKCLRAMEKYGDNHWWEPGIALRTMAYYQIHEDLLLCNDFSRFHEAVELLLGRPVWTHEFGINANSLRQEAERAWKYGVGVTSERERQERVGESIQMLQDWAEKNNKQVINIQLPE